MSQIALIAGLGYGDEGKGTMTDFYTKKMLAQTVVRYNGGPQAGHTVVTDKGDRHVFSQFGAGTLAGAATFLSSFMLVSPTNMFNEAKALERLGIRKPLSLMMVSPKCKIVTPFHVYANRIREELRGHARHGSCGMGIGETVDYSLKFPEQTLLAGDLCSTSLVWQKLTALRDYYMQEFPEVNSPHMDMIRDEDMIGSYASEYYKWQKLVTIVSDEEAMPEILKFNTVFEGAQGVLLDEHVGFRPHNTWSTCTFENALSLIGKDVTTHTVSKVGVLRAYATRHGAGPFVSEHSDLSVLPADQTNVTGEWQGSFKRGYFDLVLAEYAIKACGGLQELVITHMDQAHLLPEFKVCTDYTIKGALTDSLLKWTKPILETVDVNKFPEYLIENLETLVRITSHGPTAAHKIVKD